MKFIMGAGVALIKDSKILLGYHTARSYEKPAWGMPGGHVDEGESVTEAIKREVLEETGVKLNSVNPLTFYEDRDESTHVISFQFYSQDFTGEEIVKEPKAIKEWRWFSPEELDNLPDNELSQNTRRTLKNNLLRQLVTP